MQYDQFELLKKVYPEDQRHVANEQIQQLRLMARRYRDMNNTLVQQYWDLEQALLKDDVSPEQKVVMQNEKEQINNTIQQEGYLNKIETLLAEIEKQEIALNGYSEVNSNSPYQL